MRTRTRKLLLRAGLGLLAVAVLVQLMPYARDHTNPPVPQDALAGRAGHGAGHSGRLPQQPDRSSRVSRCQQLAGGRERSSATWTGSRCRLPRPVLHPRRGCRYVARAGQVLRSP
jgi:hypothetical protein